MSENQNPYNNNYYAPFNAFAQEGPRSLTDPSWNYPPNAPPIPYAPQYPPPQQQSLMQVNTSFNPGLVRGVSRPMSFRPARPRAPTPPPSNPRSWPVSNADWLTKIDKDTSTTVCDFRQSVEQGGAVAGDVMMEICKAATKSTIQGVPLSVEGNVEEVGAPSLSEKISAIEELEKLVKKSKAKFQ